MLLICMLVTCIIYLYFLARRTIPRLLSPKTATIFPSASHREIVAVEWDNNFAESSVNVGFIIPKKTIFVGDEDCLDSKQIRVIGL